MESALFYHSTSSEKCKPAGPATDPAAVRIARNPAEELAVRRELLFRGPRRGPSGGTPGMRMREKEG
jgi:hypothetical protein